MKIKVIKPKALNVSAFRDAFGAAAKDVAQDMHADFDAVTADWRHAVPFEETVKEGGDTIIVSVKTADLGFRYYDLGNGGPGQIIRPVRAKALHWIDKQTGEDVFRKSVHGYDGRHAVEKIRQMQIEKIPVIFEKAMSKAVKASGHAI